MKAVRYGAVGRTAEVVQVPVPACPDDGVLVRVAATGVCRSDWHAWRGHDPVALPHIPGHELAGTIEEVGAQVTGWTIGDRVTVPFVLGCGRCEYCRDGQAQVCPDQLQPGFTLPGSFAELVALPRAWNLVRLPDSVSFVAAAALGCRFATAFRAVAGHGRIRAGQQLAVFGCGGVGLSAVMIGKALGAIVIAVDAEQSALAAARELGADETVLVDDDLVDAIVRLTGGVHVGLDAIGRPEIAAASVRSLRPRGRHVQVGLLLGAAASTALPMDLVVARELEIYGSHGMPAVDYPAMLDLVAGGLDPERLVARRVPLAEAGAALAAMDRPAGAGMTVVLPAG